jgi:hypothetical protein
MTNRLTAIRQDTPGRDTVWIYQCTCGAVVAKPRRDVNAGKIRSCGCLNNEMRLARFTRHGAATRSNKSGAYQSWSAMKSRCANPKNKDFKHYGGRGISVCQRWLDSFSAFLEDMGQRPSPKHSIDRINNDGNYEPSNCRWVTQAEQCQNQRKRRKAPLRPRGERGNVKLTDAQVAELKRLRAQGVKVAELASLNKCTVRNVFYILSEETRKSSGLEPKHVTRKEKRQC